MPARLAAFPIRLKGRLYWDGGKPPLGRIHGCHDGRLIGDLSARSDVVAAPKKNERGGEATEPTRPASSYDRRRPWSFTSSPHAKEGGAASSDGELGDSTGEKDSEQMGTRRRRYSQGMNEGPGVVVPNATSGRLLGAQ
jgi:hypothetical protein